MFETSRKWLKEKRKEVVKEKDTILSLDHFKKVCKIWHPKREKRVWRNSILHKIYEKILKLLKKQC